MKSASIVSVSLIIACVAACRTDFQPEAKVEPSAAANQLQSAWVEIGEGGQAIARAITVAGYCPDLNQDGTLTAMHVRAEPAMLAQRPVSVTNAMMSSAKPAAFPVRVCELPLKPGIAAAGIAGKPLPLPKPAPLRILVLGDTGCRLKAEGNAFQLCNDDDKWAFPAVAKTAARFAPDLVIHVGDYHYRESPCPAGVSACKDSPWGYGWDAWNADFFQPAAPLLDAAPWILTRGNHESCSRAGAGWWRLLDPRALQQGRDCVAAGDDAMGDFSAPYSIPLGGGSQLIVFDSSKVSAKPLAKSDPAYPLYQEQFDQVDQLAKQADFSIFISHHPVLGFAPEKGTAAGVIVRPGNAALQSVLADRHPQRLFDSNIQLLLAGHVHLFEAITFQTDHPMQIVSGNGGSSPDADLPPQLPDQARPFEQARVAHFNSTSQSGFMTMERVAVSSSEWTLKSWDKSGILLMTCRVSKTKKDCG